MKIGMLWLCPNGLRGDFRHFTDEVLAAIQYYQHKYGEPTLCYVNPRDFPVLPEGEKLLVEKVEVKADPTTLPCHLWLGNGEVHV